MKLTKAHIEAITSEVCERVESTTRNNTEIFKVGKEWETIKKKIGDYRSWEKEIEEREAKLEAEKEKMNQAEEKLKSVISSFEEKHGMSVDWRWLEDDEEPSFILQTKNFKEKIERTIALLDLDGKKLATSEELIEAVMDKFLKM